LPFLSWVIVELQKFFIYSGWRPSSERRLSNIYSCPMSRLFSFLSSSFF
jgi:hypothetical protein